jgi:hypothetical protein
MGAASGRALPPMPSAVAPVPSIITHFTTHSWHCLCSYLDGTVYDGEWVLGVRSGRAMVTHANGSIFNGSYDNDVASGEGSFMYPGGQVEVKGLWLQGQLHGEVCVEYTFTHLRFIIAYRQLQSICF